MLALEMDTFTFHMDGIELFAESNLISEVPLKSCITQIFYPDYRQIQGGDTPIDAIVRAATGVNKS